MSFSDTQALAVIGIGLCGVFIGMIIGIFIGVIFF